MRRKMVVALIILFATGISDSLAEDPPEILAQLIARGDVSIEYYDPRVREMLYPGRALFDVQVDREFQYRFESREERSATLYTITISFNSLSVTNSHTLLMPDNRPGDKWEDPLMLHEFDHVAMSSDPRIEMILVHLIENLSPLQMSVEAGMTLREEEINAAINAAIDLRTQAMCELIQGNYDILDALTERGLQRLPDRATFFEEFYTKANLDSLEFPFTGDLLDLFDSRTFREVELPEGYGR